MDWSILNCNVLSCINTDNFSALQDNKIDSTLAPNETNGQLEFGSTNENLPDGGFTF